MLTCIEETDDAEVNGSDELFLKVQPNFLARSRPVSKVNRLQTIVDVHTPIGYIDDGYQDSLMSSPKLAVSEDSKDEGILEDA